MFWNFAFLKQYNICFVCIYFFIPFLTNNILYEFWQNWLYFALPTCLCVLKHVMNLVFLISMLLSDKYYYTPKWLCNGRNYIGITSIKTPQVGLFSKLSVCFNHFTIVSLVEDISLHLKKKKWILITQGYNMPSCTFTISQFPPLRKIMLKLIEIEQVILRKENIF